MTKTDGPSLFAMDFAGLAGELAESLSFNKSLGQIYGFLYAGTKPLSLEEIARNLSMSKGNASVNLRTLESWGAVHPVSVAGSRKDYYDANRDLKKLVLKRLQEGLMKRMDRFEDQLTRISSGRGNGGIQTSERARLNGIRSLISKSRRTLKTVSRWL